VSGLCIALPGGTLLDGACQLLADAGVARLRERQLESELRISDGDNVFVRVRPTDIPVYVEMGGCDCGIVGKDVIWETRRHFYELVDLKFGACRMVLAAPEGSALARGERSNSLRVATKYPLTAARYFRDAGITVELIRLHGSVELAPAMGLADAVLDITATGRTLAANRLVEVTQTGVSTARLIANHAAFKTRSAEINALAATLRRAAASRSAQGAA
jgi:ATP phosphoribosyltransferase